MKKIKICFLNILPSKKNYKTNKKNVNITDSPFSKLVELNIK